MSEASPRLHFGGPDLPARCLRNLLEQRIGEVPPGGEIAWSTYYLRDRALALALMAASDRGVAVTLRLEGAPRFPRVNAPVIAMLEAHGLGGGLKVHRLGLEILKTFYPYWHGKIYCFSHPVPTVLIGSFNPSGDEPEDPAILADIGDQDRGHNLLVEFNGEYFHRAMAAQVRRMGRFGSRLRRSQNRPLKFGETTAWAYPRLSPGLIARSLKSLGRADRVRGAISHLKGGVLADALAAAARRGAAIDLIVHDTERRVRAETLAALAQAGVAARRYARSDALPLHAKFLIVETTGKREAWLGSFNFNRRSYWLNHEVLIGSYDPAVIDALEQRFRSIADEVALSKIER